MMVVTIQSQSSQKLPIEDQIEELLLLGQIQTREKIDLASDFQVIWSGLHAFCA